MSAVTKRAKGAKCNKEPGLWQRLASLYARMEAAYAESAATAGLSCDNCPTNCCTSFFQHHSYVEWAYLWRGLSELDAPARKTIAAKAEDYVSAAREAIALAILPTAMCPLNEQGLCVLYPYRLMICRMHGTRNALTGPGGVRRLFPGCARFTALEPAPSDALDRTPFYNELAALELAFRQRAKTALPRLSLTLAEMILLGPPKLR